MSDFKTTNVRHFESKKYAIAIQVLMAYFWFPSRIKIYVFLPFANQLVKM